MEDIKTIEELLARTKQQIVDITPFIVWLALEPRSAIQVELYFWVQEKLAEQYLALLKRYADLASTR